MKNPMHHTWLDLPLWLQTYERAGGGEVDDLAWNWRELEIAVGGGEEAADCMEQLADYAGALGAWAQVTALEVWMPPDLVEALQALSPPLKGNPAAHAKVLIDAYALKTDAYLGARVESGRLRLTIAPESRLHRLTTARWLAFTAAPYRVQRCEWCRHTYTPQRTTSQFCSPACRQAAHRAAKQP
jgi:hypothetical protein